MSEMDEGEVSVEVGDFWLVFGLGISMAGCYFF